MKQHVSSTIPHRRLLQDHHRARNMSQKQRLEKLTYDEIIIFQFYYKELTDNTIQELPSKVGSKPHYDFLLYYLGKQTDLRETYHLFKELNRSTFYSKAKNMVKLAQACKQVGVDPNPSLPKALAKHKPSLTKHLMETDTKQSLPCPSTRAEWEHIDTCGSTKIPREFKITANRLLLPSLITSKDLKCNWFKDNTKLEVLMCYPDLMTYPEEQINLCLDEEGEPIFNQGSGCINGFEKNLKSRKDDEGRVWERCVFNFDREQDTKFLETRKSDKFGQKSNGFDVISGKYKDKNDELCTFKILQFITRDKDLESSSAVNAYDIDCNIQLESCRSKKKKSNNIFHVSKERHPVINNMCQVEDILSTPELDEIDMDELSILLQSNARIASYKKNRDEKLRSKVEAESARRNAIEKRRLQEKASLAEKESRKLFNERKRLEEQYKREKILVKEAKERQQQLEKGAEMEKNRLRNKLIKQRAEVEAEQRRISVQLEDEKAQAKKEKINFLARLKQQEFDLKVGIQKEKQQLEYDLEILRGQVKRGHLLEVNQQSREMQLVAQLHQQKVDSQAEFEERKRKFDKQAEGMGEHATSVEAEKQKIFKEKCQLEKKTRMIMERVKEFEAEKQRMVEAATERDFLLTQLEEQKSNLQAEFEAEKYQLKEEIEAKNQKISQEFDMRQIYSNKADTLEKENEKFRIWEEVMGEQNLDTKHSQQEALQEIQLLEAKIRNMEQEKQNPSKDIGKKRPKGQSSVNESYEPSENYEPSTKKVCCLDIDGENETASHSVSTSMMIDLIDGIELEEDYSRSQYTSLSNRRNFVSPFLKGGSKGNSNRGGKISRKSSSTQKSFKSSTQGLHGVDGFHQGIPTYVMNDNHNLNEDLSTIGGGHSSSVGGHSFTLTVD